MEDSYIVPGAKEEQRKRMEEQVGSVHHKLKKWADRVVVGGYYDKPEEQTRIEGEVWNDDRGRTWTMKDGKKEAFSNVQEARTPWWCPKCNHPLNHKLHVKFYRLRGACFDCVIKHEGKMRVDGVWDIFERKTMRNNEKSWIRDKIQEQLDVLNNFKTPQLHFSDGRWEEFAGREVFEQTFDNIRKNIEQLNNRFTQLVEEEKNDESNLQRLAEWEQANPWIPKPL